ARVLNRDKGWTQINDQTMDQEGEDLAELKEEAFGEYISALVPLRSPAFTLSIVGESNVDGRAAMGITASCKDHRDINFYFDKESGLLLKSERRTKDETTQQEVTEETFMSEYKEVQGFKQATKFVIKHDGKPFVEAELSDQQLVEKLDDSVFAK